MTIFFQNNGQIDLDVIRTMGVSVKTTENPIGYFGTGLKFAIATLLRTGHKITLDVGGNLYEFRTVKKSIRGQEFDMVFMGDEQQIREGDTRHGPEGRRNDECDADSGSFIAVQVRLLETYEVRRFV